MTYETIKVRLEGHICFLQLYRPNNNNTINDCMVKECKEVLEECEESEVTIIVLEGLDDVFCFGADFQNISDEYKEKDEFQQDPEPLYNLWLELSNGPYITISHVRGRVNAGGMGFVAASDIVIADKTAQFSLSELLFGVFPACVMPFLIRRIGFERARYLTLTTQTIPVKTAYLWGLVDDYDVQSESLLRKKLLRLKCLSKTAITRYKQYMAELDNFLIQSKMLAVKANVDAFSDASNVKGISRYIESGKFPWEY